MTENDGIELTAKFFEACGREVEDRLLEPGGWYAAVPCYKVEPHKGYEATGPNHDWLPVPDLAPPEHLHTVLAMVRERWPNAYIESLEPSTGGVVIVMWPDTPRREDEKSIQVTRDNPCEARMLAACRAAGIEPR